MRRAWFAVVLLALGVGAQAQPPPKQRAAIDRMLDALKAAPDERAAGDLEAQLQQAWLRAGSPVVTLLIGRGLRLLNAGQTGEAEQSFSDAIVLQPALSEAWYQRALVRYHAGNMTGTIQDLAQTVQLEPRDFPAFRTLSQIAEGRGDWKGAYAAWEKVMDLDPKTAGGEERLRMLKRKALGEDT